MDELDLAHPFPPATIDAWREKALRELDGRPLESLTWGALEGLAIEPIYARADHPRPASVGNDASWEILREVSAPTIERARAAIAEAAGAYVWLDAERFTAEELSALRDAKVRAVVRADRAHALEGPDNEVLSDPLSGSHAIEPLAETLARRAGRAVLVSSIAYHEAGASAVHELGLAMASGIEYLRLLSEAGRPLADLPRRMVFSLAVDSDFYVGIAKLRAARLLWTKILRSLGIEAGPEEHMILHARGSRRGLAASDVHTNLLRGTASAFAAIVGGANRVSIAPFDEPLGEPSAGAIELAERTQLVLREEAHLGRTADTVGGSYFFEQLTQQMARRAWAVLQEIEHLGGVGRGLRDGSIAERVANDRDARQRAVARGERVLIGVNRYPSSDVPPARTRPDGPLAPFREAEELEALKRAAAKLADKRVHLIDAGAPRARVDFLRTELAVIGLELGDAPEARAIAIAAPDAERAKAWESAPREGKYVLVAGPPDDAIAADAFFHRASDRALVLSALVAALGAS